MTASMGRTIRLVFCILFTVRLTYAQYNASPAIIPPIGNSPKAVLDTVNGYQLYSCFKGQWSLTGSYAVLVLESTKTTAGNVTSKVGWNGEMYTWTLFNDAGDAAESGSPASMVSGFPVAVEFASGSSLSQQLVEASDHLYHGAAATVSYVQRYKVSGGLAPAASACKVDNTVVKVPFSAKFCLWSQNSSPTDVPQSLYVPNGRVVEGFYAKGHITYKYTGSAWVEVSKYAKLYNLPGTAAIGEYYVNGGDDSWNIFNPNGWSVFGKRISEPVQVVWDCIPWNLNSVTAERGVPVMLGPFTHVQTTSTRGGLAPTTKPAIGSMSYSGYSAMYWFYSSK